MERGESVVRLTIPAGPRTQVVTICTPPTEDETACGRTIAEEWVAWRGAARLISDGWCVRCQHAATKRRAIATEEL